MITINLLPHNLRPIKRTPVPYMLSGLAAAVVLAWMAYLGGNDILAKIQAANALAQNKSEWADLKPVVEQYNKLSRRKIQLAKRVTTINEIASDRIIWSEQLHHLARLALDNFWYDGIKVGKKTATEMRREYNEQTKEYELKNVQVTKDVLKVTGYVMAGVDGTSSINPFTIQTKEDEEFSKLFHLDLIVKLEDTEFEDVPVRRFELEYIISPEGATRDE